MAPRIVPDNRGIKRGDKINYLGDGHFKAYKDTYVWYVCDQNCFLYVIEHEDGYIKSKFIKNNNAFLEPVPAEALKDGLTYIYASPEYIEPATNKSNDMQNQSELIIDFENIDSKFKEVINSDSYLSMTQKVIAAKKIFLMGNGGLHFVSSHASTDMTRLIPGKAIYSFDSVGFITSNANDHGYDNLFVRWLETVALGVEDPAETLLIGLSCSGNSMNVINALTWGHENKFSTHMVSGVKSRKLSSLIEEVVFDCQYFHTVEVLTLMMFYDVIAKTGHLCPTISGENKRKGFE